MARMAELKGDSCADLQTKLAATPATASGNISAANIIFKNAVKSGDLSNSKVQPESATFDVGESRTKSLIPRVAVGSHSHVAPLIADNIDSVFHMQSVPR